MPKWELKLKKSKPAFHLWNHEITLATSVFWTSDESCHRHYSWPFFIEENSNPYFLLLNNNGKRVQGTGFRHLHF